MIDPPPVPVNPEPSPVNDPLNEPVKLFSSILPKESLIWSVPTAPFGIFKVTLTSVPTLVTAEFNVASVMIC